MDPRKVEARQTNDPAHTNGDKYNVDTSPVKRPKPKWRNIIENFSAIWFTLSMNTGILGIIMHQLPYQFNGLGVLSSIMYVFNLVLFSTFFIVSAIRWTFFTKTALRKTVGNIDEMSLLGAAPIAFMTLTAATALNVSNAEWGGHTFTLVAYVMFWICVGWSVPTYVINYKTLSTTILLPIVGVATNAVVGGIICNYAYDISPRLAVPIIIVGYFMNGVAVWVGLFIYIIYFYQLLVVGWPPGPRRPSLALLVGPYGQTAAALMLLGTAASEGAFAGYDKGTFLTATAGSTVSAAGTLLGLLFLGLDYFWIFVSIWGILEGAIKRELSYSLVWWSTIFPYATTTTSFISLSIAMDSPTFRVLGTAFFLMLLIDYLINWAFTIYYSIKGDILIKKDQYYEDDEKQD